MEGISGIKSKVKLIQLLLAVMCYSEILTLAIMASDTFRNFPGRLGNAEQCDALVLE